MNYSAAEKASPAKLITRNIVNHTPKHKATCFTSIAEQRIKNRGLHKLSVSPHFFATGRLCMISCVWPKSKIYVILTICASSCTSTNVKHFKNNNTELTDDLLINDRGWALGSKGFFSNCGNH